jgi:TolB-like protein/tetratricopeptide (TPR) repeat protein
METSVSAASGLTPDPDSVSPAEVREELARLLASDALINSPRLSTFLRMTVEATLAGQGDTLKEFSIGHDVFDRGSDYDPRTDSIVRVEALRLRRKLNEYYDGAGSDNPVLISFHPGSYVPKFGRRRHMQPPAESSAADIDPDTVAVLPFVNLSADPEQSLFCSGTTEEIILELASVPDLKVLGLTTSFALRDTKQDLMAMCRQLGVGTLVEGTVRKSGDQLRIGAKTVDVATGHAVWSRSFDRNLDDIFAIQDEIAQEVAAALQAPARPVAAFPAGSAGVEAYTWYLKGKYAWDEGSVGPCLAAAECFRRSASLAPGFALPLSGLAYVYQWMALWGWTRPREAQIESRRAAQEALRIDNGSSDSHVAWAAHLLRFEWDWKGAEAALDRAVQLNPSNGLAYSFKANCAIAQSRFEEGLRFYERAVHLDPLSYRTNGAMGVPYWLLGQYEEAERWLGVAYNLKEDALLTRFFRSRLYLSMGRYEEAIQCSSGLSAQSHLLLGALGAAYSAAGNQEKAREILRFLQHQAASQYVEPLAMAAVQLQLNLRNEALDSLQQAVEGRSPMAAFLNIDPFYQPLRAEPRFQQLRTALKLA